MGVRYLAVGTRHAEPVPRVELGRPPPADFAFVLVALGAPAIVGTLRREVERARQIETASCGRNRPSHLEVITLVAEHELPVVLARMPCRRLLRSLALVVTAPVRLSLRFRKNSCVNATFTAYRLHSLSPS